MKKPMKNGNYDVHTIFPPELYNSVEKYRISRGQDYSSAVKELVEVGLNNLSYGETVELNNKMLDLIYSRLGYNIDLLEQFYADMDIDTQIDPQKSNALNSFKQRKNTKNYDK